MPHSAALVGLELTVWMGPTSHPWRSTCLLRMRKLKVCATGLGLWKGSFGAKDNAGELWSYKVTNKHVCGPYIWFSLFFSQKEMKHCFLPAHRSSDSCRSSEEKVGRNPTLPRQIRDEFSSPILTSDCKVCSGRKPQKRSQWDSIKGDFKRRQKSPLKFARETVRSKDWVGVAAPNSWEVFQSGLVRWIGCLRCILRSSRMPRTAGCAAQASTVPASTGQEEAGEL